MLFGIDYARQAIWQKRQKELAKAREEINQAREKGREEGREEGYQRGYDAGVADERERRNGANGHNWMYGGPDDDR